MLKLLTAITVLPGLPGNRMVTVSAAAAGSEGSAVGLVPGGRYSVDTLFESLLLMSGNDAAAALSDAWGGVPQTVRGMNARAAGLGAYDTVVQTPSGLDGWTQLTSAYDLTLILRAAVADPRFVAYDEAPTARLPKQHVGDRRWDAVPLYNQSADFLQQVPGALVAKSGFTDAAQHTYACAARRDGRRIGVVMLRAERRPLDQWQQAARLLDWAYRVPVTAAPVGRLTGPVRVGRPSAGPSPDGASSGRVVGSSRSARRQSVGPTPGGSARRTPGSAAGPPPSRSAAAGVALVALLGFGASVGLGRRRRPRHPATAKRGAESSLSGGGRGPPE